MRVQIVGARRMDWDELLCGEFTVAGRDFEPLIVPDEVELFRGPMGTVARKDDFLCVFPELMVRKLAGRPREYVSFPTEPVRLKLTDHRALLLPDESLVIADALLVPTYRFRAPGDSVLASLALGPVGSD